jgi:hypothetical protein
LPLEPSRSVSDRRNEPNNRIAEGNTLIRWLQDRTEIHPDFAGWRDNDRAIPEQGYKWQFWVRRQGTFTLFDPEPADYPADFLFTKDLKWIVREQKTGSGESTLYLYRLAPHGYVPTSKKPLGDLATDWRKIEKKPEYHMSAYLLEEPGKPCPCGGWLEENYRWLGVDWPANRYILITLSGEADIKGRKPTEQTSVVRGWRCRYDLQTGKFDAPALFSDNNAKAVVPELPGTPN